MCTSLFGALKMTQMLRADRERKWGRGMGMRGSDGSNNPPPSIFT